MAILSKQRASRLAISITCVLVLSACLSKNADQRPMPSQVDTLYAHQQSLVLDAHADIVLASTSLSYLAADGSSKVSPDKLKAGGVGAVVMSIAVGPGPRTAAADGRARTLAEQKLAAVQALLLANRDALVLAKSVTDIASAQESGMTAIILGFQNARSLQGNVDALDEFYASGVRLFGLNHLAHNDFSDSSRPMYNAETASYEVRQEHGGLSELGRAAIQRINSLGAIVDVSQLSKSATLQAISLSTSPVIASHSNVQAITNVTRNLSDQEIDLIGKTGGVIHVAAFGAYLVDLSQAETLAAIILVRQKHGLPEAYSYPYELYWELPDATSKRAFLVEMRNVIGPGSISDMADHIAYIVKRVGVDHVGIGNDFNHGSGIKGYVDASESLNLTKELVSRGYSLPDIKKIWGENFLRVFRQAEKQKKLR
jgi:membrane dipeptidase